MSARDIPKPLRALDQWVAWVSKNRKKPPINPRTGGFASPTDPRTWAGYGMAVKAVDHFGCGGVGFVFSEEDPFTGVDLDHCRDPQTEEIDPWAQKIIKTLKSYTEPPRVSRRLHYLRRWESLWEEQADMHPRFGNVRYEWWPSTRGSTPHSGRQWRRSLRRSVVPQKHCVSGSGKQSVIWANVGA